MIDGIFPWSDTGEMMSELQYVGVPIDEEGDSVTETINEKAVALYGLWDDCQPPDGVHDLLLFMLYRMFLTEGSLPYEAQLNASRLYKIAIEWRGAERYGLKERVSLKNCYGDPFPEV